MKDFAGLGVELLADDWLLVSSATISIYAGDLAIMGVSIHFMVGTSRRRDRRVLAMDPAIHVEARVRKIAR